MNSYLDLKVRQNKFRFQANYELYYEFLFGFKSEAKNSDFRANYELYYEILFGFKSEAKKIDQLMAIRRLLALVVIVVS